MPSGITIDYAFLKSELAEKGGSKFATPRKENNAFQILSGVFEGKSTGTPLAFLSLI